MLPDYVLHVDHEHKTCRWYVHIIEKSVCFDVYNVSYSLHVGLLVVTLLDMDLIIDKGWQMPSNMCLFTLTPYLSKIDLCPLLNFLNDSQSLV